MQRLRMVTLDAGPKGVRRPGEIHLVEDEEAKQLVEGGFAERLPLALVPAIETAMVEAPEIRSTDGPPAEALAAEPPPAA